MTFWFMNFNYFYIYVSIILLLFFFFFQAEDGIRDIGVTGVQTCALPICLIGQLLQLITQLQRFSYLFQSLLLFSGFFLELAILFLKIIIGFLSVLHATFGTFRLILCVLKDRKSTRLNSSHANISYAVFCLKKKTTFTALLPPSNSTHHAPSSQPTRDLHPPAVSLTHLLSVHLLP